MKHTLVGKTATYLKAVSEEQRLKILKILASSMAESVCVSDVAKILGISQPAATKHLKILERVNLLVRKRKGANVYYSLNGDGLNALRDQIDRTFAKGYTKCPYQFKCDECPHGETCV
jgi:DNA-binding transcriptional ArsR family regulator